MIGTLKGLYKIFDRINASKFDGRLPFPMITVQSKGKKACYGWCSTTPIWKDTNDRDDYYEINMSAEELNRSFYDIVGTMAHEMVHLHNAAKGVDDCSGGSYHKKIFKDSAEAIGLVVQKEKRVGFGITQLSDDFKQEIDTWLDLDREAFNKYRIESVESASSKGSSSGDGEEGDERKRERKMFNYMCPCCGDKIKGRREISAVCKKCNKEFEVIE